jgi:O-antigen/teichoic acid export membrane protein
VNGGSDGCGRIKNGNLKRQLVEAEAGTIDSDATDLEGLATPIAPPIVNGIEGPRIGSGAANGKPTKSLKQMATHGSLWTIAGYGMSQVLRFGSNLVLAKLLFPEAFGLMAIVNGVMQGLVMLSDVGIGQSIIRHTRREAPEFYNTAWTVQILRGAVLTLVGLALAWPIGQFYNPFLTRFIAVISLSALISGFNSTKIFTANRDLQLAQLTMVDLSCQVIAIGVMVGLAWWRHSIWALVIGSLVFASVRLILSHLAFPGPGNRLCWRADAVRELFTFGRWIFVSTMFTFLGLQTDKLILGRLVPLERLGIYAVAFAMTATVAGIFEQLVYRVLMPAMVHVSKVSNERFAEMVLRSRRVILMAAAIAVANLIILAPAIFRFLYDSRYQDAAWMTQLLCCGLWFTLLQRTGEACLLATDKSRALAQANALNFVVTLIAAPVGFYVHGISGFICGWALGNLSAVIVLDWHLIRHGVPVAGQDVTNTLMLLAFCAVGRVLQHVFHQWMDSPSLFWVADVLPAVFVSLIGAVTLVVRNRSFVLVKSGAV